MQMRLCNSPGYASASPGVKFINVPRAAFTLVDPKSAKKIDNLTVFYTLYGSSRAKAACRKLVKLTPGRSHSQHWYVTLTVEVTKFLKCRKF